MEEDWEEVQMEEEVIKKKIKSNDKYIIDSKMLFIFNLFIKINPIEFDAVGTTEYNKYKEIENHALNNEADTFIRNIIIFKLCVNNKIPIRILFVLEDIIINFIEPAPGNIVERCNLKYNNIIISIDHCYKLSNVSFLYSKKDLVYDFPEMLADYFKTTFAKYIFNETIFDKEDDSWIKKLPNSIAKLKKHPLFTMESLLPPTKTIFPKRPIIGYIKGEAVLLKSNIKILRTERQWYIRGKIPKRKTPYRISNEKHLFAEWQVEDIIVEKLSDRHTMDYFHKNHIPVDHIYTNLERCSETAKLINIDFRECVVGFRSREPFVDGIFIKNSDRSIFVNFHEELMFYNKMDTYNIKAKTIINLWSKVVKRAERYIAIKKRINK